MDYAEFISEIEFRFIKPDTPMPGFGANLLRGLGMLGLPLDVVNTTLPCDDSHYRALLHDLCSIPRMSTFAIGALINRGVSEMPSGLSFVNVGVWHGFTYLAGMASNDRTKCVGIDNFSKRASQRKLDRAREKFLRRFHASRSEAHVFHEMGYEEYFAEVHEGPIGFYIYDGSHSYENQLKGLQAAEQFLGKGCRILVDDTNADEPRQATLDFMSGSTHRYRVLHDVRTYCNRHPTWWNGVMLLQKDS